MFTQDRALLALEPNLFRDVTWLGQQLGRGSARLLTGHAVFESGGVNRDVVVSGMVLLIGRTPYEIVEVLDSTDVRVSLIRADPDAPVIEPPDADPLPALCTTFLPQIAIVHRQLLAMLGLAPAGSADPDELSESAIINPADLALVESLGALHLIYSANAAATGEGSISARKAELYKERFARERWRVSAKLDTNADGLADATRRLNIAHLIRA